MSDTSNFSISEQLGMKMNKKVNSQGLPYTNAFDEIDNLLKIYSQGRKPVGQVRYDAQEEGHKEIQ
jgi:hypothetical protein